MEKSGLLAILGLAFSLLTLVLVLVATGDLGSSGREMRDVFPLWLLWATAVIFGIAASVSIIKSWGAWAGLPKETQVTNERNGGPYSWT